MFLYSNICCHNLVHGHEALTADVCGFPKYLWREFMLCFTSASSHKAVDLATKKNEKQRYCLLKLYINQCLKYKSSYIKGRGGVSTTRKRRKPI